MKKMIASVLMAMLMVMLLGLAALAADEGPLSLSEAIGIFDETPLWNDISEFAPYNATGTAPAIEPVIDLYVEDTGNIGTGSKNITIAADVYAIPDGMHYSLQWQNNQGGSFQNVPHATQSRVMFPVDQANMESEWRVLLMLDTDVGCEQFISVSIRPTDWVEIPTHESPADPTYSQETTLIYVSDDTGHTSNDAADFVAAQIDTIYEMIIEEPKDGEANTFEMLVPNIELSVYVAGDAFAEGVEVTLAADVSGVPERTAYSLQWQNNADGSFQDVSNATAPHTVFYANLKNTRCVWRVVLTLYTDVGQVAFTSPPICPAERTPRPVDELTPASDDELLTSIDELPLPDDESQLELADDDLETVWNEFYDMLYNHGEPETEAALETNPEVKLQVLIDGGALRMGTKVTITANVTGVPEGADYSLQWQNDLSGEFRDVLGATSASVSFPANESNVNCAWRVELLMRDDAV